MVPGRFTFLAVVALLFGSAFCRADSADFVVSSGADDAYSFTDGTNYVDTENLYQGPNDFASGHVAGYRFVASGLYRGQLIQSATIRMFLEGSASSASGSALDIRADATPNSPDFSGSNPGPFARFSGSSTTAGRLLLSVVRLLRKLADIADLLSLGSRGSGGGRLGKLDHEQSDHPPRGPQVSGCGLGHVGFLHHPRTRRIRPMPPCFR